MSVLASRSRAAVPAPGAPTQCAAAQVTSARADASRKNGARPRGPTARPKTERTHASPARPLGSHVRPALALAGSRTGTPECQTNSIKRSNR